MTVKKGKATRVDAKAKADAEIATLKADIKAFGTESKSIRRKAQDIMYRCVFVCLEHKQCTPMTLLLKEMGEAWHMKAVIRWFETFGPVKYVKGDDGSKAFKLADSFDEARAKYVQDRKAFGNQLKKEPVFWEFTKNPDYKGFDPIAKLRAILTEAANTEKNAEKMASGKVKNLHVIEAMKAFASTLEDKSSDDDDGEAGGNSMPTEAVIEEAHAVH